MEESFPMIGGDGPYSYTKYSQIQKQTVDSVKEMIEEAIIEKLDTEILSTTFRVAHFGCSVLPNTFLSMQNVIEAVGKKCSSHSLEYSTNMEFQVFFNDHTANDFNTLFASLPLDRKYHAAGVPGSFYGPRLFPRASINLAHSSYALPWLSKIPEGVCDSKSTAWNAGKIHYMGASREVVKAFSDQFDRDFGAFLSAREEEIVKGGLMFLIVPGVAEGANHPQAQHPGRVIFDFLTSTLIDLANQGVIDKTEIDSFNLPLYLPTIGEMTNLIEKNGCFSIERVEVSHPKTQLNVHSRIMNTRATMEGIFTKHFGKSVVEKMFVKTLAKVKEVPPLSEAANNVSAQLFVVLKRK